MPLLRARSCRGGCACARPHTSSGWSTSEWSSCMHTSSGHADTFLGWMPCRVWHLHYCIIFGCFRHRVSDTPWKLLRTPCYCVLAPEGSPMQKVTRLMLHTITASPATVMTKAYLVRVHCSSQAAPLMTWDGICSHCHWMKPFLRSHCHWMKPCL